MKNYTHFISYLTGDGDVYTYGGYATRSPLEEQRTLAPKWPPPTMMAIWPTLAPVFPYYLRNAKFRLPPRRIKSGSDLSAVLLPPGAPEEFPRNGNVEIKNTDSQNVSPGASGEFSWNGNVDIKNTGSQKVLQGASGEFSWNSNVDIKNADSQKVSQGASGEFSWNGNVNIKNTGSQNVSPGASGEFSRNDNMNVKTTISRKVLQGATVTDFPMDTTSDKGIGATTPSTLSGLSVRGSSIAASMIKPGGLAVHLLDRDMTPLTNGSSSASKTTISFSGASENKNTDASLSVSFDDLLKGNISKSDISVSKSAFDAGFIKTPRTTKMETTVIRSGIVLNNRQSTDKSSNLDSSRTLSGSVGGSMLSGDVSSAVVKNIKTNGENNAMVVDTAVSGNAATTSSDSSRDTRRQGNVNLSSDASSRSAIVGTVNNAGGEMNSRVVSTGNTKTVTTVTRTRNGGTVVRGGGGEKNSGVVSTGNTKTVTTVTRTRNGGTVLRPSSTVSNVGIATNGVVSGGTDTSKSTLRQASTETISTQGRTGTTVITENKANSGTRIVKTKEKAIVPPVVVTDARDAGALSSLETVPNDVTNVDEVGGSNDISGATANQASQTISESSSSNNMNTEDGFAQDVNSGRVASSIGSSSSDVRVSTSSLQNTSQNDTVSGNSMTGSTTIIKPPRLQGGSTVFSAKDQGSANVFSVKDRSGQTGTVTTTGDNSAVGRNESMKAVTTTQTETKFGGGIKTITTITVINETKIIRIDNAG